MRTKEGLASEPSTQREMGDMQSAASPLALQELVTKVLGTGGTRCKEPTFQCRFNPWVGKTPWRRAWQPTPVFLSGESQGQRNWEGYSPLGHKELNTTEAIRHIDLGPRPRDNQHILTFTLHSKCDLPFLNLGRACGITLYHAFGFSRSCPFTSITTHFIINSQELF